MNPGTEFSLDCPVRLWERLQPEDRVGVAPEGGHTVLPLEEADCEAGNQAQNVAFSPDENSLCFGPGC